MNFEKLFERNDSKILSQNLEFIVRLGYPSENYAREPWNWTFVTEDTIWISNDYSCDFLFSRFNKITLWRNLLKTWFLI